jgi:TusA-related sulfurtransferase
VSQLQSVNSRWIRGPLLVTFLLFSLLGFSSIIEAADVVVVRPKAWSSALQPWKLYRESQGHEILEVDSAQSAETIRASIRQVAATKPNTLKFILLASDVGVLPNQQVAIPVFYHASTALIKFGGDEQIASDSTFGDLDGDDLPDVAVGRMPADSPQQLTKLLARTIDFERSQAAARWRREVHVVAGVGGFGALADGAIEMTTRRFLSDRIPGWADVTMTQASPQSPFCPDPWRFSETTINRMNQGGMLWVYIGHGHVKTLDYLRCNNEWLPIMTNENVPQVRIGPNSPIGLFLACYTGAFDAVEDSLAEQLVTHDNGLVAAIASSRVSGPYGLAMLSSGMLTECFERKTTTIGEILLNAKRDMMRPIAPVDKVAGTKDQSQMLSALATALSPEGYDLAAERQEHVWMMNLIGDPLLRLNHPHEVALLELAQAKPGERMTVHGTSPAAGKLLVELAYRRDQLKPNLKQLDAFSPDGDSRQRAQQTYEAANARVVAQTESDIAGGEFSVSLDVPADLPRGKYCVRAFLGGQPSWAVGYQVVSIRP